jgi:hypothetical protein
VRIDTANRPGPVTAALRTHGHVVRAGVRHVAIDVLPRTVLTFRTVCGQDIVGDECESEDVTACSWCHRIERTWVIGKASDVI